MPNKTKGQEMTSKIIRDAHMFVLDKVRSGEALDWLDKNVLQALLDNRIEVLEEVQAVVLEMKGSGLL